MRSRSLRVSVLDLYWMSPVKDNEIFWVTVDLNSGPSSY